MAPQRIAEQDASPLPPRADDRGPREDHRVGNHRLADEHAVLLREVRRRGRAVRAALAEHRWPSDEIDRLVAYLRYEVLDQAVNEERLLFPLMTEGFAGGRIHGLVDDHIHLRELTDELAVATATDGPRGNPGALAALLEDLEESLDRHMCVEQAVLATATSDGVESLRRPFRCHLWFPVTEGPELDLDVLPREFAYRAVLERFSGLRPGARLLVRSSCELGSLWNVLTRGQPGEFGWVYLEEGPEHWCVEVTRRFGD